MVKLIEVLKILLTLKYETGFTKMEDISNNSINSYHWTWDGL